MKIKCIKDTEGYWTEGEMYPARQNWRAGYISRGCLKPLHKACWRGGDTSAH